MPINVANCRTLPTTVSTGNFNGGAFVPLVNGLHRHYTAANCRVNLNPAMNVGVGIAGLASLNPQAAPAGDTYFLPFATGEITSMVLPAPGGGAAPQSFLTTNLPAAWSTSTACTAYRGPSSSTTRTIRPMRRAVTWAACSRRWNCRLAPLT
ncbi:hypothetical protein EVC45_34700 [Paraburkholderia sp. UYCP14C]|uniref:hypothetical protein n=1 Tax=Paraburkholderia sp. UYCP14C TaxID=2511130 RepID=UPI00101F2224|nr:hypothetical protein [Paraburkholderia sp. UYCP14C]RZF25167.1 hypothetical protein EVC45_34700 [Paraburkholderia sp. UYCP14C]